MDTTILRSNLNSARMTCGLAQRPEYRDLMTAASKLTGERVNRSTHNHSVRGREAVCAGVNYCGSPGCDLVLVVRGYQIRCAGGTSSISGLRRSSCSCDRTQVRIKDGQEKCRAVPIRP